ncbi:MAG: integrase arm-type DNA-binding domain-containing protein [Rhodoplanes sp.]
MAKHTLNKLSARRITTATKRGRYGDGGGLYLVVASDGSRKWVFRFAWDGKQRDMGLGAVRDVPLAEARMAAAVAREHVRAGRDPIAERDRARRAASGVPTFGEMADQLVEGIKHGFRNEKHRAQWRMTLTEYAKPLRPKPVDAIATEDVLACLKPIWQTKAETASRVRGRIERVLDAARAKGYRTVENPARWRGHLDSLLPKHQKLARGHHAAMPFAEVPEFLARLREMDGTAARALEFAILTAARSGEVLGARWSEIDLEAKVWTVPAARMKAAREHRVPLPDRVVAILETMSTMRSSDFVFPGSRRDKPQSDMTLTAVLRRMNCPVTVHGFRSSFRDWAGERTHFPREVAEAALAHVVGDETERAYRRGDSLEKRRELMDPWTAFCEGSGGNVVAFPTRA